MVVVGHWLMAAPYMDEGRLSLRNDMLQVAPWTQWLTWLLQVMPLFFIVGGYANAVSWQAAQRSGAGYGAWIAGRLQRLVKPTVPLLAFWTGLAVLGHLLGVSDELIRVGSQFAMIPTWFLAVYVLVIVFAPVTHALWRRYGMSSFWALVLGAVCVDTIGLSGLLPPIRWVNYLLVWLSVHHLGYLWYDGRLAGPSRALPWALAGFAMLLFLVTLADYPVSMITVPGEEESNSRPPTIALLALGALHAGIVLSFEERARRWLRGVRPWAATVLVNGSIMTLYLWHVSVLVLVVGLAWWLGGIGLRPLPNSGAWWATRPLWIGLLFAILLPLVAALGRFEQEARATRAGAPPPAWQSVLGAVAVCAGLTALSIGGIGAPNLLGIRVAIVTVTFLGAFLVAGRLALPGSRGPAKPRPA